MEHEEWIGVGTPTEIALVVLAAKMGLTKQNLAGRYQFQVEFPFDSTIKRMGSVYMDSGIDCISSFHVTKIIAETHEQTLFVKGAPEAIFGLCDSYLMEDPQVPVTLSPQKVEELRGNGTFVYLYF